MRAKLESNGAQLFDKWVELKCGDFFYQFKLADGW